MYIYYDQSLRWIRAINQSANFHHCLHCKKKSNNKNQIRTM